MLTRSIKAMIILIEAAAFGYFVAPNFILSNPPYKLIWVLAIALIPLRERSNKMICPYK